MRRTFEALGKQGHDWLTSERIPAKHQKIRYQIDMRYYRQGYEFPIGLELDWLNSKAGIEKIEQRFKDVHYQNYEFNLDHPIEVVNLRAVALGIVPKVEVKRHKLGQPNSKAALVRKAKIYLRGKYIAVCAYDRARLVAGNCINGPAIITQSDSTTLVLPGHYGYVDPYLNILIWPNMQDNRVAKRRRSLATDARAKKRK